MLLEENRKISLWPYGRQNFLKLLNPLIEKKKIDKFDYIEIYIFCLSKNTIRE